MSNKKEHLLPMEIQKAPLHLGVKTLHHIADSESTNLWHQGWISGKKINLPAEMTMHWDCYIFALLSAHIHIFYHEDETIWDYIQTCIYTPKVGYIQLNLNVFNRDIKWWWK